MPNNSAVRSLACDNEGNVYVGATGDFGYLSPDSHGKMQYRSFLDQLDSSKRNFNYRVEKIHCINKNVYFIHSASVFQFREKKLYKTYDRSKHSLFGFPHHNDIYLGNFIEGLQRIEDNVIVDVKGGNYYDPYDLCTCI